MHAHQPPGEQPVGVQECSPSTSTGAVDDDYNNPSYKWFANRWSNPDVWCGEGGFGQKRRTLSCTAPGGLVAPSISDCQALGAAAGPRPNTELDYPLQPCSSAHSWVTGVWMGCTDNSEPCRGSEHRHKFCVDAQGKKVADVSQCELGAAPLTTRVPCGCCNKCVYVPGVHGGVFNPATNDQDENLEVSYDYIQDTVVNSALSSRLPASCSAQGLCPLLMIVSLLLPRFGLWGEVV